MTTRITIAGADFSANAVGFIPPVADGLAGWFYLGDTIAETQRDRAGIADGVLVGSPTINAGYVSFNGYSSGQRMQTSIVETANITLLTVARSSDAFSSGATKPMFVTNYGADPGHSNLLIGASIYVDGGTPPAALVRLGGGQDNNGTVQGQVNTVLTTADATIWNFYAGSLAATSSDTAATGNARKLYNSTTAQTGTSSNYPRVPHTVNTFRVGAAYNANFSGFCDIAFAAIYNRVLSDAEVETIYQAVKTRLAGKHSITI